MTEYAVGFALTGFVLVEAENREEAKRKAEEQDLGKHVDDCEVTFVEKERAG